MGKGGDEREEGNRRGKKGGKRKDGNGHKKGNIFRIFSWCGGKYR